MSLFSAKVEEQAEARAAGRCEDCGGQLKPGKYEFDHIKPRGFGGDNSLANCRVRCVRCHIEKTQDYDMPPMREADRKAKMKKQLPVAEGKPSWARRFRKETDAERLDREEAERAAARRDPRQKSLLP